MEDRKENMEGHKCAMCWDCLGSRRHSLLRIIIGIAVLLIVFWSGFKFGEFKAFIGSGFYGYNGGYNMMNRWNNNSNYGIMDRMMNGQYR